MTKPKSHTPWWPHIWPWKTLQNMLNLNMWMVFMKFMFFVSSENPCPFLIILMNLWCMFNENVWISLRFSYKIDVWTPKKNMSKWSRSRFNQKCHFWIEVVKENRPLFGGPQKSDVWIPRRHVRVVQKHIEFIRKNELFDFKIDVKNLW